MLVLHSSSACDVCLDPYTSDSSSKAPHAIPCGHIFCGECLATVDPANCPLCRKPFLIERMKKLHVDKPESLDEVKETEFLQRLILAWDASEEELLVLLNQVGEWLENKEEDESMTLRTSLKVLSRYKKLRTRRADDHRTIKRLRDQLSTDDHQRATESQEFKAVEASLITQIEGLQSQLSTTQDEVLRLRTEASVRPGVAELTDLRYKVDRYEAELEDLRPIIARAKKYEHELKKLRQELDYYAYPSSNIRDNPLPQPPAPVSYDHLPTLTHAITTRSSNSPYVGNDAQYTTNSLTNNAPSHSELAMPKKSKGKEREPGPSYNLYSSSPPPFSSSEQVLRGASPSRRVVPTAKSKPPLPSAAPTLDPKIVSGARPDLPVPPTPQAGVTRPVDPARDFMDPYTLTAAYISEYATGYGQGFQLAEYTPGQRAVEMRPGHTGLQATSANGHGGYANGHAHERREQTTARGLDNMNTLGQALSNISATPTAQTSQLSRDGNSQIFNYDTDSTTTADASSLASSLSSRVGDTNPYTRRAPRESGSQSSLFSTDATGYATDTATLSSFRTGTTYDTTLTRNRSLRQQPVSRRTDDSLQSGLGIGLPSVTSNMNTDSSRPRNVRQASLPHQSALFGTTTTTTTVATATTTTTAAVPQPTGAPVSDNRSVRTSITQASDSSWGTINSHSAPFLDWQSTGGSSLNLPLRTFAAGAGMPLSNPDSETDVNLFGIAQRTDTWVAREGTAANDRSGREAGRVDSSGTFPVMRESDEERTPVSRSTRTLASVSSAGATVGSGSHVLDMLEIQARQQPQLQQQQTLASQPDRERERDRNRDRDRTRSHNRRQQTHPASLTPASTGEGTRHAQMMTVTEHTTGQSGGHQYATDSGAHQPSQLWFAGPPASYTQPPTSQQSQNQRHSQSQSRRAQRRLSVATAPVAAPVSTQHTGPQPQSTIPNTAPIQAAAPWSEAGYYTDGPSSLRPHNAHNTHNNTHNNEVGQNSNALTSPTLFSSNSSSNALGLDGMNEPRPLQITAPTPIVSSRSFLRSFSYDTFSSSQSGLAPTG